MKPILFLLWAAASLGASSLDQAFREQLAAQPQPAWVGYTVPAVSGEDHNCEYNRGGVHAPGPVHLEPPDRVQILFRIEGNRVGKIRVITGDCELDADGLPLRWIRDVRPAESVALLTTMVTENDRMGEGAITAIALHGDPAADQAIDRFAAAGQSEWMREKAIFWLGAARGRHGYETLRQIVTHDPSEHIRDKAIFALSVSREPQALDTMIAVAHDDANSHVRSQAIFWVGQKAGKKAAGAISDAIEKDPDTEVKKKAVFALHELPDGEGVPKLIEVARTNRNPAVRKQAMFWLGQCEDPRALAFFEEVLKR